MHIQKTRLAALLLALTMLLCACQTPAPTTESTQPSSSSQPTEPSQPATTPREHADDNGDELCDICGIDVTVELDFYAFNDLHGVFNDTDDNPGLDELTTYLKNAYADESAYEILLSSGDMWQGSVESSTNKGQLMTQWMNHMGFVSMTIGNHEFDWGSAYIAENALAADFPFLGINITDTNVQEPYCQPSVVIERGGVKIGIIGAIGDVLSSVSGEFTPGVEFAVRGDLTKLVKEEATRLRGEGCQLIIYSLHAGYDNSFSGIKDMASNLGYYNLELSQGYVDLVFESHSHQNYVIRDKHGVYHLQGGGYNSGISFANICYNLVTDTYEIQTVKTLDPDEYAHPELMDDPVVDFLYGVYFPEEDPYTTVLGRNNTLRSSNEIGKTVAQLYLQKGQELWGEAYNVVLGGGFIKTRTPYDLQAGDVTYSQLYSLLPFDNALVLCQVTGKQLREKMLGSSSYFCAYEDGLRDSLVDTEIYYIVTDTYTSFYKYNMFTEIDRLENYYARDLLKDFIAQEGWGAAPVEISIEEANAIGQALQNNETTFEAYELTGVVSKVANTTYGNLYIKDEEGNAFYIYGLYDASGRIRYDAMENPPKEGDVITVIGAITKYVNAQGAVTVEMKGACLK